MYARQQFREARREVLVAAIRSMRLGTIVASGGVAIEAVHLPMIVRECGTSLVLEGHVATANPFWQVAATGAAGLAIFQGPQAYVHPRWLEAEQTTGKAVPTWSYVAVHARGKLLINREREWLLAHVEELTALNEAGQAEPWAVSDAPQNYIEALLGGIVGVRLEISDIEGVWKMVQHSSEANRLGVIAGLSASDVLTDKAMAAVMLEHERNRTGALDETTEVRGASAD